MRAPAGRLWGRRAEAGTPRRSSPAANGAFLPRRPAPRQEPLLPRTQPEQEGRHLEPGNGNRPGNSEATGPPCGRNCRELPAGVPGITGPGAPGTGVAESCPDDDIHQPLWAGRALQPVPGRRNRQLRHGNDNEHQRGAGAGTAEARRLPGPVRGRPVCRRRHVHGPVWQRVYRPGGAHRRFHYRVHRLDNDGHPDHVSLSRAAPK